MKISERLKKVREYLGLTQKELADKLGFPWHKIKNIETEKHKLTSEIAENIEQFYSISGWWLLTGKGEMLLEDTKKTTSITNEEQELLINFKELPKDLREIYYKEIELEALKTARKKRQNNPLEAQKETNATA